MRMEDLKHLLEIERCRSINKAAQNLYLAHSTLSYNLQNIERELGYQIFTRTKKGVVPTPRGSEVLNGCRIILDMIDHWHDQTDSSQNIRGHVQVTAVPIFARVFGMDILMQLRKEYPEISLRFEEKKLFSLENVLSLLNKSTSRIFVASLSSPERAVVEHMLQSNEQWDCIWSDVDELVLHISAKHPLGDRSELYAEELSQLPMLFYPDSDGQFGYRQILRHFPASQTFNISTAAQVLDMVGQNLCVSLASRLDTCRSEAVRSGAVRCVHIHAYPMPMNYCVLFPREPAITPAENVVLSSIRQCFVGMAPLPAVN